MCHNEVAYRIPPLPHGRQRRINNRNSVALNSTSNPLGRELVCEYRPGRPGFKSSTPEEGGFRRGCGTSPSRRGRVR